MKTWIKGGIVGSVMGFIIWFWDYDLFLNFGGPNTPLSDSIRRLFGFGYGVNTWSVIFPLLILILIFGVMGILIGKISSKNTALPVKPIIQNPIQKQTGGIN